MAKKHFVYSSASNDTVFTGGYRRKAGGIGTPIHRIVIKGGANVYSKKFQTRSAVETEITAEQLELLQADPRFVKHVKDGFFVVTSSREDADEMATKLKAKKDKSAQLTKDDYEEGKAPTTEVKKK